MEGHPQFTGILPVLILILYATSRNGSVDGDQTFSIERLSPLQMPSMPSIGRLPPLQIPSMPSISGLPLLPIPSIPSIDKLPSLPFPSIPALKHLVDSYLPNITTPAIRDPSFCNFEDATALLSFRAQLSDPRDELSSWNPMTDCCTWRGVTCSGPWDQRRVTGLRLSNQNYERGTSSLAVSSYLRSEVAGIPLSGLSALETLSLTSILFNTNLPSAWGILHNLHSLSLVNCGFTGYIPDTYLQLNSLRHLYLSDNQLTGELPLYATQVFRQLQTLDLSSNAFTGGINLLFSSNLSYLDLSHNEFDNNPLPDVFFLLPGLRYLDLSHNRFRGSIPWSLQFLQDLRYLDLSANGLGGSIPPAFFSIPSLTSVFLHDNQLSGWIPTFVPNSSGIEALDLSNNSLSGIIPPTICFLGKLQSLDLSSNKLSGAIPDTLILNSNLEFLFLDSNKLLGFIPPELAMLHNLVLANVSDNLLIGPIPFGPWPSFPASAFQGNPRLCGPPLPGCLLSF